MRHSGWRNRNFSDILGVSRQAVSKWESGKSDPGTTNPLALAAAMVGLQGLVETVACTAVATAVTVPLRKLLQRS